jgi:transcription antitermination factor NusA-like protein
LCSWSPDPVVSGLPEHFEAAEVRQLRVEHDQVVPREPCGLFQGRFSRLGERDLVALGFQVEQKTRAKLAIVLDDEKRGAFGVGVGHGGKRS